MPEHWTYLCINLFTIAYPLAQSFEWRLRLYKNWKPLFLGIFGMGLLFLTWDVWFTSMGVWGFNPKYISGVHLGNLPLGEWLFFLTVPYACIFIYEVLNYYVKKDVVGKLAKPFALAIGGTVLILGLFNLDKWYTATAFILTGVFLLVVALVVQPKWLGRFFLAYFVSLAPFLIVNGILTGSWIPEQVVWYNDTENLGIRIGTIPIEDTVYNLLMLLLTISIYEWRLKRDWVNWEKTVASRKKERALSISEPVAQS